MTRALLIIFLNLTAVSGCGPTGQMVGKCAVGIVSGCGKLAPEIWKSASSGDTQGIIMSVLATAACAASTCGEPLGIAADGPRADLPAGCPPDVGLMCLNTEGARAYFEALRAGEHDGVQDGAAYIATCIRQGCEED